MTFDVEHVLSELIGTMPMDTIANFGFGLTHGHLDAMVAQRNARTG
jgi:hypothetical protein